MSNPEQTLQDLNEYLKEHPKDANAWNTHGVLLATMKQFGPALRSLDHAIKLDSHLHQAHTNRGRVLLSLGLDKAPDALKSFDTALKLKPNDLDALRDKAVALRALNRGTEEMDCLKAIVAEHPDELGAWQRIGDLHLEAGAFPKAESVYLKVIELDDQRARAHIHLAISCSMQEKWNDAIKYAETACKLSPEDVEAWRVLGDVNLRAGKNRSAMKALKKASSIDPTDAYVENTMGMLQYTIGNPKEATRHFKRAIIRDRAYRRAYRNLALISMELEEWKESIDSWEKFIRFEKKDPDAFDALATCYARVDDFCGAADAWEKARKLFKKNDEEKHASRLTGFILRQR